MFEAVTENILVQVEPAYVPEQSSPMQNYYYFSYRVRIVNQRKDRVQLLSRHWIIADGFGKVEEVSGPGVVGKQPQLLPGGSYEYTSFCPLPTPTGSMKGTYTMVDENGKEFDIQIPQFLLTEPNHFH